jgi:hypothetical protein
VVLTELHEIDRLLAEAEQDLANLDVHRAELLLRIKELKQARNSMSASLKYLGASVLETNITNQSSEEAKISLFRSLFRGREDVYPKRFESLKQAKKDTSLFVVTNGSVEYAKNLEFAVKTVFIVNFYQ